MPDMDCGRTREMIPDVAAGRAAPTLASEVERHTASCEECASELALVRLLLERPPAVPDGLARRVMSAVRQKDRAARRPAWGLAAAAIAAVAIGIGTGSRSPAELLEPVPEWVVESSEEGVWIGDDGLVAGAPVLLEELSDEALEQLLAELADGSWGDETS